MSQRNQLKLAQAKDNEVYYGNAERIHEMERRATLAIFDFCSSFSIYLILL